MKLEEPRSISLIEHLGVLESAVWLSHARVLVSETKLGESAARAKEASCIRGCAVDAVAGELLGHRGTKDSVTLEARIDDFNLYDDLLVCEADDEAVLGYVVLVLRLCEEALADVVVGLSLPTSVVLLLGAGEVGN